MSLTTKTFVNGQEAQKALQAALIKLAKFVMSSYGPVGRRTVIYNLSDSTLKPLITNDGVTILRTYFPEDEMEMLAKDMLLETASKIEQDVGDGTTTSVIIAAYLTTKIMDLRDKGFSPILIGRYLSEVGEELKEKIKEFKLEVSGREDLYNLALTTSRDDGIATALADVYQQVGKDALVEIEANSKPRLDTEVHQAVIIKESFKDRSFAENEEKLETIIENPLILLTNKKITKMSDLEGIIKLAEDRNLLIICNDVDDEALGVLRRRFALHKATPSLPIVFPLQVPHSLNSEQSLTILEDLSALTGAKVIDIQRGGSLFGLHLEDFGQAEKVVVDVNNTKIFGYKPIAEKVAERQKQVDNLEEESNYSGVLEFLAERRKMLTGKYAAVKVGAHTDVEAMSIWKVVEDTVGVLKSAYKEGFLPGGGTVLLRLSEYLGEKYKDDKDLTRVGVAGALGETMVLPFKILSDLAEIPADKLTGNVNYIISNKKSGLNFKTGELVEDLIAEGVADSFGSVHNSLDKAVSLARTLVSMENIVMNANTPQL